MSLSKAIDTEKLTYYDSVIKTREDTKLQALPISNSMEYVKWYFRTHRDGKVYGVKFAYDANNCLVAAGTKYGANTGLVAQASTRTVSGRNDYDYINVFKHFDANAHLDANGNTIIDAIRGDSNFSYYGKVDVVCVFAPVYERIYTGYESSTKYLYIEWCDSPKEGFTLNKLCKDANGNNKGFYCIAKFQAGLIDGVPYASAGLYPWTKDVSQGPCYDNCIDVYHSKHEYLCSMTIAELAIIQRIYLMKYSSTNYQSNLNGLTSYNSYGVPIKFSTNSKNYIVIPSVNAANLYLNTRVSIGTGNTRGKNHHNIINNTEILSKNSDIIIFNDLTTTEFTITDASYNLVSMPNDILCTKLISTGEAKTVENENITATFNNGSDVEVNLILDVNGTTYSLYAYDGSNNEIGHSTAGNTDNTILYISDNISTTANSNYVETAVYKSGYSLEIYGSDGCYMMGTLSVNNRAPSVISGIELLTGALDVIGNAIIDYNSSMNVHIKLCNNPNLLTKDTTEIDTIYTDIGYITHVSNDTSWEYGINVHYDLDNGGFVVDCGDANSIKGLCDGLYLYGSNISGKYGFIAFASLGNGPLGGPYAAIATYARSTDYWAFASRPSLNGVMG